MSAALDDLYDGAPAFVLPEHVRRRAAMCLVHSVESLDLAPARAVRTFERPLPASRRLTRRGVAVLALAVALAGVALMALAWLSAPAGGAAAPMPAVTGDSVVVSAGDSLWAIAGRVAPNRDPRAEVAQLQRLNHLDGVTLVPGQVLRVH